MVEINFGQEEDMPFHETGTIMDKLPGRINELPGWMSLIYLKIVELVGGIMGDVESDGGIIAERDIDLRNRN
jgi:hypothetical protein